MNIKNANFAIVHDWFLSKSLGGSEKVTLLIDKLLINNYSTPGLFSLVSNIDFQKRLLGQVDFIYPIDKETEFEFGYRGSFFRERN